MKKLKNPRKYIERLKRKVEFLEDVRNNLMLNRGQYWFSFSGEHKITWSNPNALVGKKPGDEVIVHGTIKEIHLTKGNSECILEVGRVHYLP